MDQEAVVGTEVLAVAVTPQAQHRHKVMMGVALLTQATGAVAEVEAQALLGQTVRQLLEVTEAQEQLLQ